MRGQTRLVDLQLQRFEKLLADPNLHRTNLGSNQLWQIGLLEMWLQQHAIG